MVNSHQHQKNYRVLLDAMSRPGRLTRLAAIDENAPFAAALAIGHCLLDHEVSLCTMGHHSTQLQATLTAATRVRIEALETADFLFISGAWSRNCVNQVKRGHLTSPEEGATVVYCLDNSGPSAAEQRLRIRLTGPGIASANGIIPEMSGIALMEFETLMVVNADYPLGVDAFFVRPNGELMALPRSTRIQVR